MITADKKRALGKALALWCAAFAAVAGFLYYHSTVPIVPVVAAGALTLVWTVVRTLKDDTLP